MKTAHLFLEVLFQTTKADGLAGTGEKLRLKLRFLVFVPYRERRIQKLTWNADERFEPLKTSMLQLGGFWLLEPIFYIGTLNSTQTLLLFFFVGV